MRRWIPRQLAVLAIVGMVIGLIAPSAASAHTRSQALSVRHGTTTVTTAPGVAPTLLAGGIAPFVTAPGRSTLALPPSGPTLVASYPVAGGYLALGRHLQGQIRHEGGLLLVNVTNGKQVMVDGFVIDLKARVLTAHVVGTTARIPVFGLDLRRASIVLRHHTVTVHRVGLVLTDTAATALNGALGTKIFAKGLVFGTASTSFAIR